GAAVDVELLHGNAELVAAVDHLDGEGLVQLPEIDLLHAHAGAFEQARHREHGPDAHLVGLAGRDREAAEDPERMQPAPFGETAVHDHAGRSAVRELTGVARGDVALLDRKSTRLNSSHRTISYAVFCLKK